MGNKINKETIKEGCKILFNIDVLASEQVMMPFNSRYDSEQKYWTVVFYMENNEYKTRQLENDWFKRRMRKKNII